MCECPEISGQGSCRWGDQEGHIRQGWLYLSLSLPVQMSKEDHTPCFQTHIKQSKPSAPQSLLE